MSSPDARSHNGCWTCRARRKKCDESSQPCKTCTGLHLTCHGYGPRPIWMDGDMHEKAKVMGFKAAVKRYSKQKQRSKDLKKGEAISIDTTTKSPNQYTIVGRQVPCPALSLRSPTSDTRLGLSSPFPDVNNSYFSPESFEASISSLDFLDFNNLDRLNSSLWDAKVDRIPVDLQYRAGQFLPTPPSSSLPLDTSMSNCHNLSSRFDEVNPSVAPGTESRSTEGIVHPTLLPQASQHSEANAPRPASAPFIRDQEIFQHFFQQVFQSQIPFLDEVVAVETASQLSQLTARSLVCLASLGFQVLNHKSSTLGKLGLGRPTELNRQAEFYGEIIDKCLDSFKERGNTNLGNMTQENGELLLLEVHMCLAQTIYSKIVQKDDTWPKQIGILECLTPMDYGTLLNGNYHRLEIIQELLVSLEILASTSTGQAPVFASKVRNNKKVGNLRLEHVVGCNTSIMENIRTISELQAWKHDQALNGSLSFIELARRALKAEQELNQARQNNLELSMIHTPNSNSKTCSVHVITNIFACAASIYLHVVVSGARPEIPEIKKSVTDTIEALTAIPNVEIVKCLTWPICITACLADGDNRAFFEKLEKGIADEYGVNQKVLRGIKIARECWRLGDRKGERAAGKTYDWRDGMASLGEMALLF